MGEVAKRIRDMRLRKLFRAFLMARVSRRLVIRRRRDGARWPALAPAGEPSLPVQGETIGTWPIRPHRPTSYLDTHRHRMIHPTQFVTRVPLFVNLKSRTALVPLDFSPLIPEGLWPRILLYQPVLAIISRKASTMRKSALSALVFSRSWLSPLPAMTEMITGGLLSIGELSRRSDFVLIGRVVAVRANGPRAEQE